MADPKNCNITFNPEDLLLIEEGDIRDVRMSMICRDASAYRFDMEVTDKAVAKIISNTTLYLMSNQNYDYDIFTVDAKDFGLAEIEFFTTPLNGSFPLSIPNYDISVLKDDTIWDDMITYVIAVVLGMFNLGFGVTLDLGIIMDIIRKPIGPGIGFVCQFLLMPPLSFGMAVLFNLNDLFGLGLIIIGSCPGGGASNALTYLLEADLELSILMTALSTIAATGMTPFWVWLLSPYFTSDLTVEVPATDVLITVLVLVGPLSIGVAINTFSPVWGKRIAWCLKPSIPILGVPLIIAAFFAYYDTIARADWETLAACSIMPIFGFGFGFTLGYMILKDIRKATTICIETGIQSTTLALLIVNVSLPSPESELAALAPIIYTFTSITYPILVCCGLYGYRYATTGHCMNPKEESYPEDEDEEKRPILDKSDKNSSRSSSPQSLDTNSMVT